MLPRRDRSEDVAVSLLGLALLLCAGCGKSPTVVLGSLPRQVDASVQAGSGEATGDPAEMRECDELDPVCGSDGQTYQNVCRAAKAGAKITKIGPC